MEWHISRAPIASGKDGPGHFVYNYCDFTHGITEFYSWKGPWRLSIQSPFKEVK